MSQVPPVLVAGMHRGGTSVIGQILLALGIDAGPRENLIGATDSNRHGHFEVREITALNEKMLMELGGSWLSPPSDFLAVVSLADSSFRGMAENALHQQFGKKAWFLKDPRLSLLLPFWKEILPVQPVIIAGVRSPQAAAQSLQKRDGLSLEFGEKLSGTYLNALSRNCQGSPSLLVSYEKLLEDPVSSIERIAEFLKIEGCSPSSDIASAIAILDGSDNHHGLMLSEEYEEIQKWHGLKIPGYIQLSALEADQMGIAGLLAEKIRLVGHHQGVAQNREEKLVGIENKKREVEEKLVGIENKKREVEEKLVGIENKKREVEGELKDRQRDLSAVGKKLEAAQKEIRDLSQVSLERDAAILERERALSEVESIRAFRAVEVNSTTYQLVSLVTRGGARLAPLGTFRRRGLSSMLFQGRKIYSRLRKLKENFNEPEQVTELLPLSKDSVPAPVVFPLDEKPQVSIIIPVFGQVGVTDRCLRSVLNARCKHSYEVVVVDDNSPDRTGEYLAGCTGLTVVSNEENLGYLLSTNKGVESSSGDYVILLNNDTEVSDGWIDDLLSTFDEYPDTGLVGACLIYPDGRLQEAGAIIFKDGSGWNYGRFQDPGADLFASVREVDYCSAACVAIQRNVWDEARGFDERFAPAYYEDVDLAFTLRLLGWKVRYQPRVKIIHYEGISHGTDDSSGLKAHQKINRSVFVEKWATELQSHYTNEPQNVWKASARSVLGKILVADYEVPHWDCHAGGQRMKRLLELLIDLGWHVVFVPGNKSATEPYASFLRNRGIEIRCAYTTPEEFISECEGSFDVAILSRPDDGSRWLSPLRTAAPATKIIYDTVDLHSVRLLRAREIGAANIDVRQEKQISDLEQSLIAAADGTFVVSAVEKSWISKRIKGASVSVIPLIHDEPLSSAAFTDRSGILFIGSWNHPPNRDAIDFLVDEIMPLVWSKEPGIYLHLVGSDHPSDLAVTEQRIVCHGWVESTEELFNEVKLSVAPLRYGAGLKGKVAESFCRGVPVVGTSVAFEGFNIGECEKLIMAETAEGLTERIVDLHRKETAWEKVREKMHTEVTETLGPERVAEKLKGALVSVMRVKA
jgi:GT2 family glycosyltransferase